MRLREVIIDQPTMDWLKENGKRVGAEASEGNKNAQRIVTAYEMLYRLPEPCAAVCLEQAVLIYRKDKPEVKT